MTDMFERYRMVPMALVMGTIFYFSHKTGDSVDLSLFSGMDKIVHFAIYSILALTVIFAHRRKLRLLSPGRVVLQSIVFCVLYAFSDEYHQSFIPGRMVSGGDILADTFGILCTCLIWLGYCSRRGTPRS